VIKKVLEEKAEARAEALMPTSSNEINNLDMSQLNEHTMRIRHQQWRKRNGLILVQVILELRKPVTMWDKVEKNIQDLMGNKEDKAKIISMIFQMSQRFKKSDGKLVLEKYRKEFVEG